MKIRGVILSTCAMVVFFAAYAMAHEPEPLPQVSAKPVKVPYLNKTISEVKNEYEFVTDGDQPEADGDRVGSVENLDTSYAAAVLKNAGRVEGGEGEMSEPMPELVESEPDESAGRAEDPVLTYLGTYTATAYCACPICTGEYSTGYTASGTFATEGRTVACNSLPFGTQVYIEGYGYYTVEDTGWSPYGDAWLDLFYSSHDSALAFGVRNVEVYLVN